MKARNSLLPLVLLLLSACTKPAGDYLLVSLREAQDSGGSFRFEILLDDSTAVYATALAARIATGTFSEASVDFDITVTSPSGATSIERVAFPLSVQEGVEVSRGEGPVIDYEWPYRENIRVSGMDLGTWQVAVAPADPSQLDKIYAVGLSYEGQWEKEN